MTMSLAARLGTITCSGWVANNSPLIGPSITLDAICTRATQAARLVTAYLAWRQHSGLVLTLAPFGGG